MNRLLSWLNLAGVGLLTALCLLQWRANRTLQQTARQNAAALQQQTARQHQEWEKFAAQTREAESLRQEMSRWRDQSQASMQRLAATEGELRQLQAERQRYQTNLQAWTAAVAARDERLQQIHRSLQSLLQERDEAVKQFNELASRHNQLVQELDQARRLHSPSNAPITPGVTKGK